jgi:hypothetical protein
MQAGSILSMKSELTRHAIEHYANYREGNAPISLASSPDGGGAVGELGDLSKPDRSAGSFA